MRHATLLTAAARTIGLVILAVVAAACVDRGPATLAIGAPAPAFSLPGIDGKTHSLADYARSPVLVVVFTCNHCPVSQLYEQRIQQLHRDYRDRGVALVAINPDSEKTIAAEGSGLFGRAGFVGGHDRTGQASESRVPVPLRRRRADRGRRVQSGRDAAGLRLRRGAAAAVRRANRRQPRAEHRVKSHDVRAAIDALLAQQPVRVAEHRVAGCPLKRQGQTAEVEKEQAEIEAAPVSLQVLLRLS